MIRSPPIKHIEKLEEWLKKYPSFNSNVIFHVYEYMPLPGNGADALVPVKTSSTIKQDIVGETSITRNVYLVLYARQHNIDDFTLKSNIEFLTDFHHWAVEELVFGKVPKFGNTDTNNEVFEIVGALRWQDPDSPETEDYMWQLHLQYKLLY